MDSYLILQTRLGNNHNQPTTKHKTYKNFDENTNDRGIYSRNLCKILRSPSIERIKYQLQLVSKRYQTQFFAICNRNYRFILKTGHIAPPQQFTTDQPTNQHPYEPNPLARAI